VHRLRRGGPPPGGAAARRGFNLTNRQGTRLRDLLVAGRRVVLHGRVSGTGLEPYFMDVVVATISGTDSTAGELVFSAHLDHPKESANDNASGSAAILDIARSVRELIAQGRLPRPRRTLRFLWVPEWHGTMAYVDRHPELAGPALGGRVLANMNLDMVGENLELLHSQLVLTRTPWSLPSAVNDVVANVAAQVAGMDVRTPRGSRSVMNWRVTPYQGGSDHMMFIDRGIPGIMFSHDPDYTHHTSEDTPDKVDPVELERSELIAAGAMLYLADLTDAQGADLAHLVAANGAARLGEAVRSARTRMLAAQGPARAAAWYEALNAATHAGRWERDATGSVRHFADGPMTRAAVEGGQRRLEQQERDLVRALMDEARAAGIPVAATPAPPAPADGRVPVRLTRGPLDFGLPESRLPAEAAVWYDSLPFGGDARFELVNLIDGARTVTRIRDALSAEFDPVPTAVVARYLEDLVRVGVLRWR
jgi:aminopeptidase YwaD